MDLLLERGMISPKYGYDIKPFQFGKSIHPISTYVHKLVTKLTINGETFCIAGGYASCEFGDVWL